MGGEGGKEWGSVGDVCACARAGLSWGLRLLMCEGEYGEQEQSGIPERGNTGGPDQNQPEQLQGTTALATPTRTSQMPGVVGGVGDKFGSQQQGWGTTGAGSGGGQKLPTGGPGEARSRWGWQQPCRAPQRGLPSPLPHK